MMWIQRCQRTTYYVEIANIESKNQCLSLVRQLTLFLDVVGYVHCGGRIHNAPLQELARFLYLLPTRHTLTRLIVTDAHCTIRRVNVCWCYFSHHSFQTEALDPVRSPVYPVSNPEVCDVQDNIRKAIRCSRPSAINHLQSRRYKTFTVSVSTLLGLCTYVTATGVNRKHTFCLPSTRAVHLELVPNMSEESFMLAFRRFTSRKSSLRVMVSDNATTFSATSNHLSQLC